MPTGLSLKSWNLCIEEFLAAINGWRSIRVENPACSRPLQKKCGKTRTFNILTQEKTNCTLAVDEDSPFILKPL